ncbi:hypothetical protein BC830DRAFT_32307 [Chytriomyces sp. MP71]|nr:hypothetical protein BC830DRAFT_32307 [Chytriomyces sp. MP71]
MAQAISFDEVCSGNNWDRGADAVDPDAPPKPWPAAGQIVYIQDPNNYCLNMPNPKDPYLIETYWSKGMNPSFVQAEGHVQAFCVGDLTTGGIPFPPGAVKNLHIRKNQNLNGKAYHQITGKVDCDIMNMTCTTVNGDDGGQYDSVPYRNCGKEPYSGVDLTKNPGFTDYVEIGNFCMRTCVAGQVDGDPCTAKGDTLGCGTLTQGTDEYGEGFTMIDGDSAPVSFTPKTGTSPPKTRTATAAVTSLTSGSVAVSTLSGSSFQVSYTSIAPGPTGSAQKSSASGSPGTYIFALFFLLSRLCFFI